MSKVLKILAGLAIVGGVGIAANQAGIDVPLLSSHKAEFVTACKTARHRPTHRIMGGQRITEAELNEMCSCLYELWSADPNIGDDGIKAILATPAVRANGFYNPIAELACYVPPK